MAFADYIRNLETEPDGSWAPGKTYTFELKVDARVDYLDEVPRYTEHIETMAYSVFGDSEENLDTPVIEGLTGEITELVLDENPVEPLPPYAGKYLHLVYWMVCSVTVPVSFLEGSYYLKSVYSDIVDYQYVYSNFDFYEIVIAQGTEPSPGIPDIGEDPVLPTRPDTYEPDQVWSWPDEIWVGPIWVPGDPGYWDEGTWEDGVWEYSILLTAIGGGRYNVKTLAFGKDGGTGVIYIGD